MKKQIAIRALVGLGLGLGFAILQFIVIETNDRVFHDHTVKLLIEKILTAPAEWLCHVWGDVLRLPPHSELAWVLVPVMMVSIQWGLIGFLAGLWWGFRSASSANTGSKRIWPVVLIGGGALVACGLLVLILGIIFSPTVEPVIPPKPNGIVHSQEYVDENKAMDAIEANPNDAEAYYRLGVILTSKDQSDDFSAMVNFCRALEINPNYAEANYQLGSFLVKEGMLVDAITYYRKALAIKPDFAEARQHLEEAIKMNEEKEEKTKPEEIKGGEGEGGMK